MKQIARNLTDPFEGFLRGTGVLLMDRDGKFCNAFWGILEGADVNCVQLLSRRKKCS